MSGPLNPNTPAQAEAAFQHGSDWDRNSGREQTRLFAEAFHRHVQVPFQGSFSVLDIGCALGDALPVWKKKYPEARLYGCDVAKTGIERCQNDHGSIAEFFLAGFGDLTGQWDIIFCSNVLEHFDNPAEIASGLIKHCKVLYVMVPYMELRRGKRIVPDGIYYHLHTFDKHSFDSLTVSRRIIFRAPGAWGGRLHRELVSAGRKLLLLRRPSISRQIVFEIQR